MPSRKLATAPDLKPGERKPYRFDPYAFRNMAYRSRQRKHGGGKFRSERQRRYMWATRKKAAKKWAHNRKTHKSDWRRTGR